MPKTRAESTRPILKVSGDSSQASNDMTLAAHRIRLAALTLIVALAVEAHPAQAGSLIDECVSILQHDSDVENRARAAVRLGRLGRKTGNERAVVALTIALETDKSSLVRAGAAKALGRAVTSATSEQERDSAVNALKNASARDKSRLVRRHAAVAIAKIADSR